MGRHGGLVQIVPKYFKELTSNILHGVFGCPDEDLVPKYWDNDSKTRAEYHCKACFRKRTLPFCHHEYGYIPGGKTGYTGVCKLCKHMTPIKRGDEGLEIAMKTDEALMAVAKLRSENGH